jgi:type II secretory ATPase GspE/PulE/Tfp pilus assembly ATPase PilB-like protein
MTNPAMTAKDEAREFVNRFLMQAAKDGATDIELVSVADTTKLSQRVAGETRDLPTPPPQLVNLIVERIKTMAGLDLDEVTSPQAGKMILAIQDREYTLKIQTVPTDDGEQVTMNFLQ